jgi:hypothetical protein
MKAVRIDPGQSGGKCHTPNATHQILCPSSTRYHRVRGLKFAQRHLIARAEAGGCREKVSGTRLYGARASGLRFPRQSAADGSITDYAEG